MKIKKFITGSVSTNTYIIEDKKVAFLLDPGGSFEEINKYIQRNILDLKAIINTHGHFDHILLNKKFKDKYNCDLLIHKLDAPLLSDNFLNAGNLLDIKVPVSKANRLLSEDDKVKLKNKIFSVIETPGHTKGGICLYCKEDKILFSGDTLFKNGMGRIDLEGGDYSQLKNSLIKLSKLPKQTKIYPGHGLSTTIGDEFGYT